MKLEIGIFKNKVTMIMRNLELFTMNQTTLLFKHKINDSRFL